MKDFKNEYVKTVESEIPDLWARIEKGLDEADGAKESESPTVISFEKKKNKINYSKIYATLGAIAACLIIGLLAIKTFAPSRDFSAMPAAASKAETAASVEAVCEESAAPIKYEAEFNYTEKAKEADVEVCESDEKIDSTDASRAGEFYGKFMASEEDDESTYMKFVTEDGEIINVMASETLENPDALNDTENFHNVLLSEEMTDKSTGEIYRLVLIISED